MLDKLLALEEKLTPERRAVLYKIAGLVAALLVVHGVLNAEDSKDYLEVLALLLGVAAPVVAKRNVSQ